MAKKKKFPDDCLFKLCFDQEHPMYDANKPLHPKTNPMRDWIKTQYSPRHIEVKFRKDPRRILRAMLEYAAKQSYWHKVIYYRLYNHQTNEIIYEGFINEK